jgi:hypothetical protein
MNHFQLTIRAEATAETLAHITGQRPTISYGPDFARLYWTPDQQKQLTSVLVGQIDRAAAGALKPGNPGPIRVEYGPIVNAAMARRAGPPLLAVSLALIGLGWYIGRRGYR